MAENLWANLYGQKPNSTEASYCGEPLGGHIPERLRPAAVPAGAVGLSGAQVATADVLAAAEVMAVAQSGPAVEA